MSTTHTCPVQEYLHVLTKARQAMSPSMFIGEYRCLEDFLLRNGRYFTAGPKPPEVPWGMLKQCYRNATSLAVDDPRYTYVEGYAFSGIVAVQHAWVVTGEGVVVDNTWKPSSFALPLEQWVYFGIPFRERYLRETVLRNERYGVLSGSMHINHQLLQDPEELWRKPLTCNDCTF